MPTPPWTYSKKLGGEFVWNPRTDEIVLKDGRRYPRPRTLPTDSLSSARYEEPLPFQYTGSPPGKGSHFDLVPGAGNATDQYNTGNVPAVRMQAGAAQNPPNQVARGPPNMQAGLSQPMQALASGVGNLRIGNSRPLKPPTENRMVFSAQLPDESKNRLNISDEGVKSSLFPDFKLRGRDFYRVGRVFLVLWSEPAGAGGRSSTGGPSRGGSVFSKADTHGWEAGIAINHLNERVFSKVRRFVVIREDDVFCTAIPISTYGGRGVAKPGVKKSDHCIIYTGKTAPAPRPNELPARGENGMRPIPIRVDPDNQANLLDVMSRLNLATVMTVQHNIKTKAFGKVNERSMRDLIQQFQSVFSGQPVAGPSTQPRQASQVDDEDGEEEEEEDVDESGDEEDSDDE